MTIQTNCKDRADDPTCQDILAHLTEKVLDGWDPDAVAAQMAAKRADTQLLGRWGRNVQPDDSVPLELITRNGLS